MKQPSPVELMAFADGELDEPRASEVAGWLAEQPAEGARHERRQTLHRLTAEAARVGFAAPASFDVSDAIMAAIAAGVTGDEAANDQVPAASETPPVRRAPAEVTPLPPPRAPSPSFAARRAASRPLMVFGALVAVAAASLLWWRTSGSAPVANVPADGPSQATATAMVASVLPADDDVVIGDDGAAVTSVDFGDQSGAIFYVPGTSSASAVVWVDDNDATP